jgi:hypothetical protein
MARVDSGWLYLDKNEAPKWCTIGQCVRITQINNGIDFVLSLIEGTRKGKDFSVWQRKSRLWVNKKDGYYKVLEHQINSIYLRFESNVAIHTTDGEEDIESDDYKETPPKPGLDPDTCTLEQAIDWAIRIEIDLLESRKVPQGWSSTITGLLERVEKREKNRNDKTKQSEELAKDPECKKIGTSESDILTNIINNSNTSPRDKMAALSRLNELDILSGKSDNGYNPIPVIIEIKD